MLPRAVGEGLGVYSLKAPSKHDAFAAFTEWSSEADDKAYAKL